jgi:ABC-2 type transport system ATP-binding protein
MAEIIIRLHEVRKQFSSDFLRRRREVLQGISLDVERGETFAFLGHNGAGKTTTIKALLGLIRLGGGEIEVLGRRPGDRLALGRIGYLPENPYFYDHLTGRELLGLMAELHGLAPQIARRRVDEILELVGMRDRAGQRMRGYSKGMLQRIGLGQALINDPDLVVLDEPMGGLDPIGRHHIRAVISELKARGKTIFLSSHILSEVEAVADRASILSDGVLRRVVDLKSDERGFRRMELQCRGLHDEQVHQLREQGFELETRNDITWIRVDEPHLIAEAVLAVQRMGAVILQLGPVRTGLEQVFVQEVAAAGSGDAKADHVVNTRDQVRRILDQISDQTPEESPEVRS